MVKLRDKLSEINRHRRAMRARPKLYSLINLIISRRGKLDEILGEGGYSITESPNAMIPGTLVEIATVGLVATIFRDRNFLVSSDIRIHGDGYDAFALSDAWLLFLGIDRRTPRWPTDEHGWVVASPETMLEHGLRSLQLIWAELGNSPAKARDATIFIDGYHAGYSSHFLADELPDEEV